MRNYADNFAKPNLIAICQNLTMVGIHSRIAVLYDIMQHKPTQKSSSLCTLLRPSSLWFRWQSKLR